MKEKFVLLILTIEMRSFWNAIVLFFSDFLSLNNFNYYIFIEWYNEYYANIICNHYFNN